MRDEKRITLPTLGHSPVSQPTVICSMRAGSREGARSALVTACSDHNLKPFSPRGSSSAVVVGKSMSLHESDKLRREAAELQALACRLMEQAEKLIDTSKELEKKIKKR